MYCGEATSDFKAVKTGIPQDSVLGPCLYFLYNADIPVLANSNITIATFTDDTSAIATHENYDVAVSRLQTTVDDKISSWSKKWKIKLN